MIHLPSFGPEDLEFTEQLIFRFAINFFFAWVMIALVYKSEHRVREYSFSLYVTNFLIFFAASLFASTKIKTGFAFGLFALLSIMRFRTEQIQTREMVFMLAMLIMAVINSLVTVELPFSAIFFSNVAICAMTFLCAKVFINEIIGETLVIYDNTELLHKSRHKELVEDLQRKTGIKKIRSVQVLSVNYLTDSANLKLTYPSSVEQTLPSNFKEKK
jgi:uncharacterized membrane protein SirB2